MTQLMKVDVKNPTGAARVIHGGPDGTTPYRIEPGETKEAVLSEPLIRTLRKQAALAGEDKDVVIVVKGPYDDAPEASLVSEAAEAADTVALTSSPPPDDAPQGHAPRRRQQ